MSTDSRPPTSRASTQPGGGWTPPTVEHLQALLPQYEITAMLGHGGMGAVYKGRQKSLDRVVAIKILPPGLENSDAKFVERFQNEARTMAKLMHPGIVAVFDFGETAEGQLYFVMEYVDGTDVAKMIQSSGKLPQDYALAITAHVCDALAYAHGFGVVHRDIKPANILVNMQGQIKVADFGLAKADDPAQTSGLTKTGYAMGTPDYVSPEALIMGSSIDGRADLYAIGVMLYQMLTGEIPRGLFQMPNVRTKGETDPRFDAIISKAMQTDREARYQTASELRKALDVILTTPHIKQDASQAVAAVPQQAVAETPGKRSAVAAKPAAKGPKQPQQAPQKQKAEIGKEKSNTGLWLGIAAVAVVVIGGAVFMFSGGKPKPSTAATPAAVSTPVKTSEPPKPKPSPPVSTPTPKPAAIAPTNSTGWIDGLAEWLAKPENAAQVSLQKEGTAWRYKGPQSIQLGARLSPPNTLANVAVRYSVRLDNKSSTASILLRTQKAAGSFYQATVYGSGSALMSLSKDRQLTRLASYPIPAGFDETAAHVIEFRAEGDKLTLLVDGAERGSVNDTTYASGGFSVTGGLIDKIEYRDLGSAPATPVVAGAGSDGWIDGLAEWLAVPANATKSTLQKEGDGWRYKGPESIGLGARLSPPYQLANVAVRLTSKGGSGSIGLRDAGGGNNYHAMQSYPNFVEIRRSQNKEHTTLAKFKLPPGFKRDASYVMEFRAEGEVLTLMVNGQTLGSIKDSTFSSGKFHVSPLYALIEKLEYRELPASPPSAAKNASAIVPVAPVAPPAAPPADPKLAALLPNYTKAITNGLAAAATTDKPAFEAELARLKNNTPLPDAAEDAKLPAELKRLRGILREQLR
jgi:serine/threonine protein kinase